MVKTSVKGICGVSGPIGGIVVSHAAVNDWLQTISLVVGIAVGIASFVSLMKKKKQKPKIDKNQIELL